MISPASFSFDVETAQSNVFQTKLQASSDDITRQALVEFDQSVSKLRQAGVSVVVYQGDPNEQKPNAVFPNNWLSTWPDGRVFLYPMATSSRRIERDQKVLDQIASEFTVNQVTDLSSSEDYEKYLESTGVIIFDHLNKIAYGCISVRCDEQLFVDHVSSLGYQPVTFHAYDQSGAPIYHTNVMMGVQSTTAVICSETITDAAERAKVLDLLGQSRQVVDIRFNQMLHFCSNVLEVQNQSGEKILVVSQSAFDAFSQDQLNVLSADKTLLTLNIPTIEKIGGGSARCMLAEIFLPKV